MYVCPQVFTNQLTKKGTLFELKKDYLTKKKLSGVCFNLEIEYV